jgi:SAM-dependent methyltransferase
MVKMKDTANIEDIIGWDIPNWSVALDYWRDHTTKQLESSYAMEIGSRFGGISLWAALQGMNVLCTDLDGATEEAIQKHRQYQVEDRIKYAAVDAMNIPYQAEFDIVLFKSILGGIGGFTTKENQVKAIREMYDALKPGGELWFAENLVASPFHQFFRDKFIKPKYKSWGMSWRYITIPEMSEYLSIFENVSYTTVGFLGCFGRTPMQWSLFGNFDRAIGDKLVPPSWRYIAIGVARKAID